MKPLRWLALIGVVSAAKQENGDLGGALAYVDDVTVEKRDKRCRGFARAVVSNIGKADIADAINAQLLGEICETVATAQLLEDINAGVKSVADEYTLLSLATEDANAGLEKHVDFALSWQERLRRQGRIEAVDEQVALLAGAANVLSALPERQEALTKVIASRLSDLLSSPEVQLIDPNVSWIPHLAAQVFQRLRLKTPLSPPGAQAASLLEKYYSQLAISGRSLGLPARVAKKTLGSMNLCALLGGEKAAGGECNKSVSFKTRAVSGNEEFVHLIALDMNVATPLGEKDRVIFAASGTSERAAVKIESVADPSSFAFVEARLSPFGLHTVDWAISTGPFKAGEYMLSLSQIGQDGLSSTPLGKIALPHRPELAVPGPIGDHGVEVPSWERQFYGKGRIEHMFPKKDERASILLSMPFAGAIFWIPIFAFFSALTACNRRGALSGKILIAKTFGAGASGLIHLLFIGSLVLTGAAILRYWQAWKLLEFGHVFAILCLPLLILGVAVNRLGEE